MILRKDNIFLLQTKGSSYFIQVLPSGHIEHIHYGASIISDKQYEEFLNSGQSESELLSDMAKVLGIKHKNEGGNMVVYSPETYPLCLEVMPLEMSGFGKGDIREPMVELTFEDGSSTCDFLFESAEISDELTALKTLPCSYNDGEDKAKQLVITLKDTGYDIRLKMIYKVYPECDTITRSAVLINDGNAKVKINRLLSNQIDFQTVGYQLTSFHGRWADEMGETTSVCNGGKVVNEDSNQNRFLVVWKQPERLQSCRGNTVPQEERRVLPPWRRWS